MRKAIWWIGWRRGGERPIIGLLLLSEMLQFIIFYSNIYISELQLIWNFVNQRNSHRFSTVNWSLQPFSQDYEIQLLTLHMLWMFILSVSSGIYSIKSTPNARFLRKFYLLSQSLCYNLYFLIFEASKAGVEVQGFA